jgi:hypothetical protein
MKEDIQDMVDDLVREYKERVKQTNTISTYMGVPLTEFSVEELVAIIDEAGFTKYIDKYNKRCIDET